MVNYFNTLNFRQKLSQLGKCRLMQKVEFENKINYLKNKKIVIIGCGAQGLNQGLNMRDSGLDISYVLREETIKKKLYSWQQAVKNGFVVGDKQTLIPSADLVINLTPDKEHSEVIRSIQPLMKYNSILGFSHGFNIVEVGEKIRYDITVIMVAPKCPGTEVRKEYQQGFGVPALIAVHPENNPKNEGILAAKAWAVAIGSDRVGVLESSFIAEVKSDLMGEQTVLCGMLQVGSIIYFDKLVSNGIDSGYASKLIQYGWEVITDPLKKGGITLMMDRLSSKDKIRVYFLSEKLKVLLKPLFEKHMDDIMNGVFSEEIMNDWNNNNINLLNWRNKINKTSFEKSPIYHDEINEQTFFDNGIFMVTLIKSAVELSFEVMVSSGIVAESAYYESLHELPFIANTIARKRLYEMNLTISDTAEYGSYLFTYSAMPLISKFINEYFFIDDLDITKFSTTSSIKVDNFVLQDVNKAISKHSVEVIGDYLRSYMYNKY